jgi:hypothetical protein
MEKFTLADMFTHLSNISGALNHTQGTKLGKQDIKQAN